MLPIRIFYSKPGISCYVALMDGTNKEILSLHICKQ